MTARETGPTRMPTVADRVRAHVAADFTAAVVAHDLGHLDRVAHLASRIAEAEGADPEVARVSAYVHDHHRLVEDRCGEVVSPEAVWPCIQQVLAVAMAPRAWWPQVRVAVALTGRYTFAGQALGDVCGEAKAVHDADNLDAIGAIGIARAFMYGGAIGEPLWMPETLPADVYREGPTSSVIAHCYEKLIRLRDDMLTELGRALAEERTAFLMVYLRRFHEEWGDLTTAPLGRLVEGQGGLR
jgi:uncharacterized protein